MAPEFSLEDETGKLVSLSDFRGKVVLINFGGVYCGPCVYEHKNYLPGLLENYKGKDLVFIRITTDANKNDWKNQLKKDALPGEINLFAKMQSADPVCKLYNIGPIPIYCVIGKNGAILNANAPRPSDMIKNMGHTLIDDALNK